MPRKTRTVNELREASNHLHYEVWMLSSLANGIASGIPGQGPIANALLESFVIHVRAIMDFLYADCPQADDVIAEDFFDNSEQWTKIRPALSQTLSQAKRRAGKEVAHLTYARLDVTPETKSWPFVQITNEVSTVINAFFQNVPKDKLGSQWKTNKA
jgi:hypothetical protein